ncbi:MAG TPA: ABC transporter permease [Hyphomonadaceae bacterium]|nr:ABC transporter permease [Hyphomonadaceae bacterium]
MMTQALAAEWLKLTKNRWAAFWAWGFVPVLTLVLGVLMETFSRATPGGAMLGAAAPVNSTLEGLGSYGNIFLRLFPIAGAATLFAGEYRWETWRSILPRNERASIMLAKLVAFACAGAISVLLCGLAGFLTGLYEAFIFHDINWPRVGTVEIILALLIGFLASFLQLLATAGVVIVIAVVSRSMIASIIGSFSVFLAAELLTAYLRFRMSSASEIMAFLPNVAGDALRQMADAFRGDPDALGIHLALPGAATLLLWCVALSATAILLFRRQDLSRE